MAEFNLTGGRDVVRVGMHGLDEMGFGQTNYDVTVEAGETLETIAEASKIDPERLHKMNQEVLGDYDPGRPIKAGTVLKYKTRPSSGIQSYM